MKRLTIILGLIGLAALAFSIDAFSAQLIAPAAHATALGLAQPFADPGAVLAMAIFGTHDYWWGVRHGHKAGVAQMPVIATTSDQYPDGIIGSPAAGTGLVGLLAFENFRAACLASGVQSLIDLGNSTPHAWAYDPVLDQLDPASPEWFNVMTNCANAQLLGSFNPYQGVTLNTPDPDGKKRWISDGKVIPDAGALPTHVGINDLPGICAAMWKRSALQL